MSHVTLGVASRRKNVKSFGRHFVLFGVKTLVVIFAEKKTTNSKSKKKKICFSGEEDLHKSVPITQRCNTVFITKLPRQLFEIE